MDLRTQKQFIFGLIFILIVGAIGYGLIDYFFVVEATCFDNVQNGIEEGVDCGLLACGVACEPAILPLSIQFQKFIEVRPGDYDFVARIYNSNSLFGALRVKYELSFVYELDIAGGDKSFQKVGTFYILPGQTRYVIVQGIRGDSGLANVDLEILEVEWEKVQSFENLNFSVQRKNYTVIDKNGIFSELEAVILNNSDFDFDKVEVGIILFDGNDNIIAINSTDIRTFLSRTERYFKVSWPIELPANAVRQDIEVLTNVFENSNFIKRYGTQERFQKYY